MLLTAICRRAVQHSQSMQMTLNSSHMRAALPQPLQPQGLMQALLLVHFGLNNHLRGGLWWQQQSSPTAGSLGISNHLCQGLW